MKRSPRDDLQADEPDKKKLPVGSVDGDTSLGGGDNPLVIHEEDEEESNDSASFRKFHANLNPSPLSTTPTSSAGLATSPFFPVYIFQKSHIGKDTILFRSYRQIPCFSLGPMMFFS